MEFHVVHVTSEMHSYVRKQKKSLYIIAVPEIKSNLHGKNLIIDESLYGLKIFAAIFHEHLSESLLRLGFKKTKQRTPSMTLIYVWCTRHPIMND
jgi:hypothetical protein